MIQDSDRTPPSAQKVLGRYRLLQRIGRGGMGDVWLAEDPSLHRQVAIKTLPAQNQQDQEYVKRFEREAQAIAALTHPHILSIHDYGQQEEAQGQVTAYIVMPYIPGGSLAERIASATASSTLLPPQEAITYLTQAAEAIDYAHQRGILHRDIKPQNMLLREDGWLLLADFGIARILQGSERVTRSGAGFGTPDYMAPEQARGQAEIPSDHYSLAVIAYQLCTGHLPFSGETGYATIVQHLMMPPRPPRELNPALSPATEAVLLRGLAKDPRERPQSARAFVTELRQTFANAPYEPTSTALASTLPLSTQRLPALLPGQHERKRALRFTRRKALLGGGAVVAALGGGLAAWSLTGGLRQSTGPRPQGTHVTNAVPALGSAARPLILRGHNKPAATLAWSPQALVLASAGKKTDGQVFLWDMQQIFNDQAGSGSSTLHKAQQSFDTSNDMLLAWSPDGSALAIGNTAWSGTLDHTLTNIAVYDANLATFAPGYNDTFAPEGVLWGLAWIQGDYLVALNDVGAIDSLSSLLTVWPFRHIRRPVASISLGQHTYFMGFQGNNLQNDTTINTAVAEPGATTLALSSAQGVLIGNLDLSTTTPTWTLQPPLLFDPSNDLNDNGAGMISWSHRGNILAALQDWGSQTNQVTIWDLSAVKQPRTLLATTHPADPAVQLYSLAWSSAPSDTLIAAGSKDGTVYIWDSGGTNLPIRALQGPRAMVSSLAWSADGAWLAAGYNDAQASILVWRREEVVHGH